MILRREGRFLNKPLGTTAKDYARRVVTLRKGVSIVRYRDPVISLGIDRKIENLGCIGLAASRKTQTRLYRADA